MFSYPNLTKPNLPNGVILVPQYNKYISIYNTNNENKNNLLNNDIKEPDIFNKGISKKTTTVPSMTPKITRIVVKRPNNLENDIENSEYSNLLNNDDNIISSILQSILSGNSSFPVENKLNFNLKKNTDQISKPIDEIVIPLIDYDNMIFIKEKPKNIDDLLSIISKIGSDYQLDKYYNLDIKRLNNIKNPLLKLSKMVGLDAVKSKIVDIILYYLQRLDIKNYDLLHTIIDGAPGTGKTEIAHIYSEILMGLGILSKNTFKTAKKNDFIGGYLGHTALKTMKLLEEVKGGVLFIDEIYSFGSGDGKEGKDIYAKEFVDLLMQYMSENKGDFVLVVAGYKNDIKRFFLSMNDGLERRFPIHLSIGEYSALEMYKIFLKKVEELKWKLVVDNEKTDDFFVHFFEENKEYFKFFGGDMEVLLTKCKYAHSRNLLEDHTKKHRILTIDDFKNGFELFKLNPEIEERKLTPKYQSYFI
jgi:stage V sporulation protein K